LLAAPDKFRGTATAAEVAGSICRGAARAGWRAEALPLADGGEGTLEAFGGPNRITTVVGPLGYPVDAPWRLDGEAAVIEMSRASGLALVGGAAGNSAVAATTTGTGQLILTAVASGARRITIAVGGSATTDGGLGALEVIAASPLRGIELEVACDVDATFCDAATRFAAQKGASETQVGLLRRRLESLAEDFLIEYGVDVGSLPGSGAGGGLAGGLAALGAELRGGFDLVAAAVGLASRLDTVDLVVTGEGAVDAESFRGKVVGGVLGIARARGIPTLVVAGQVLVSAGTECISLVDRFGAERAYGQVTDCIEAVVAEWLGASGCSF